MSNSPRISLREFVINHQNNVKEGINIIEASARLGIARQSYKTRFTKINRFLGNTGYKTLQPIWGRQWTFECELKDLVKEGLIVKEEQANEYPNDAGVVN
tara:strand:+ start:150 stop:449 length:300 start_codon:yes stop_codon:yes gene_type:complete